MCGAAAFARPGTQRGLRRAGGEGERLQRDQIGAHTGTIRLRSVSPIGSAGLLKC